MNLTSQFETSIVLFRIQRYVHTVFFSCSHSMRSNRSSMAYEPRNVTELNFYTQNVKLHLARHQIVKNCSFYEILKLYLSVKNASKWTILRWRCAAKMVLGIRFVTNFNKSYFKWILSKIYGKRATEKRTSANQK